MTTQINSLGLEKGLKIFFEDTVANQTAPSITFENNSNTGLYFNSADTSVNLSIGGNTVSKFTGTRIGLLSDVNPPRASVDLGYTTDALILPSGTTAQRESVTPGSLRYNVTDAKIEFRDAVKWKPVGAGLTVAYHSASTLVPEAQTHYLIDTTSNTVTVTLPDSPDNGTIIAFSDYTGTFSINNLIINSSGSDTIADGSITQLTLENDLDLVELAYWNGNWSITNEEKNNLSSITITESQITDLGTNIALVSDNLGVFSTTTSTQLRNVISDETGSGSLVFGTSPTLSSPTLTGTPIAPTPSVGTNTTQIATTAFVNTAINNATLTTENIQDAAAPLLTNGVHSGVNFTYDDANNRVNATIDPLLRPNTVTLGTNTVDCSLGDNFTRTIASNSNFVFTNAPSGKGFAFMLRLTLSASVTVTWPSSVDWPGGTAPTLSIGSVNILGFFTDNGGITWYGNALINFS